MEEWKFTLLEYAHAERVSNAVVYAGYYKPEDTSPLTYTVGLLQRGTEKILIDTGYDPKDPALKELVKNGEIQDFRPPAEVVRRAGIRPEDVKHVIITHAHCDHMAGIRYFPNAVFYLQKEELTSWITTMALPREYDVLKAVVRYEDVEACVSLMKERRLVLLDGDVDNLFPGIDIRVARNGHTFAMNMVLFRTKNGKYLFTGDAAYVKGNVIGAKKDGVSTPNGYAVGSLYQVICTLQDILKIVGGNADRILAGHEPGVWSQFPSEITEDNLHIAYVAK